MIDNNSFYAGFYSTSLATKMETLRQAFEEGAVLDRKLVADAISDGCGGCEQLTHGATLVSVLTDHSFDAASYIRIIFGDTPTESKLEMIEIKSWRHRTDIPNDSLETYLEVMAGEWSEFE